MFPLLNHSLMTKLSTPPFFFKLFKNLKEHITLLTYLYRVHDVEEPEMLNEPKSSRPRPRPEARGRGRGQKLEAEARSSMPRPRPDAKVQN